ncbi:MAG: hypothetical protein IPL99_25050 [Candidatus Competibacteraceae bacterium]|nr:hypothetical protein [Candidatus Competibacteraceae bacterium]
MALHPESKYPTRRASVLKVHGDAKPDALAGRLENRVTGRQREFASSRELLDSIASDFAADASEPLAGPTGGKQQGKTL